ncbi:hypothetical protein B0T25DRAFT_520829 [Lasiosphaeria hispida]|uniref:Uncharacterized protein n=1 Tax=Lasiosphaeria hispida TaxID=260671 RepID=A0AAJ0MAP1_9PEZI|nr:hypothetical protein B0T25DRAFT_520829 [Lasiosphaeria hispida]
MHPKDLTKSPSREKLIECSPTCGSHDDASSGSSGSGDVGSWSNNSDCSIVRESPMNQGGGDYTVGDFLRDNTKADFDVPLDYFKEVALENGFSLERPLPRDVKELPAVRKIRIDLREDMQCDLRDNTTDALRKLGKVFKPNASPRHRRSGPILGRISGRATLKVLDKEWYFLRPELASHVAKQLGSSPPRIRPAEMLSHYGPADEGGSAATLLAPLGSVISDVMGAALVEGRWTQGVACQVDLEGQEPMLEDWARDMYLTVKDVEVRILDDDPDGPGPVWQGKTFVMDVERLRQTVL